jgi:predicted aconitase with swiveling domain
VGGVAEGEALVTRDRISGWGGIDPRTGTVIETRHELRGQSFAGKVLVFPGAKGSSGWSAMFHMTRLMNGAGGVPVQRDDDQDGAGRRGQHAPSMTDFERDPLECIATGDWVRVDADRGVIEITKKNNRTGDRS